MVCSACLENAVHNSDKTATATPQILEVSARSIIRPVLRIIYTVACFQHQAGNIFCGMYLATTTTAVVIYYYSTCYLLLVSPPWMCVGVVPSVLNSPATQRLGRAEAL